MKELAPHLTRSAIDALTKRFGLPAEYATSQDWDLVVADPTRTAEFVHLYATEALSDDERFALMSLIVASLDELGGEDPAIWRHVRPLLSRDVGITAGIIRRWALLDAPPDFEDEFAVTADMQDLARELDMR